jgi:hypothetical protein
MTKERPILFTGDMVRALLDGSKTQTRRAMKPQPCEDARFSGGFAIQPSKRTQGAEISVEAPYVGIACLHGQTGDRLWVREAWKTHTTFNHLPPRDIPESRIWYIADAGYKAQSRYRQGMFMPRWASRITLEITGVRVERLQDITRGDCMAEGCPFPNIAGGTDPVRWYRELWQQINGPNSWDLNPWVWAIEFKRVRP